MDPVLGDTKKLFILLVGTLAWWLYKKLSTSLMHTEVGWNKMT